VGEGLAERGFMQQAALDRLVVVADVEAALDACGGAA
jgi:hypothetical protein